MQQTNVGTIKKYTFSKKLTAREETIIKYYRRVFHESLPKEKQYWSMCAQCAQNGKLIPGTELDQVLKEGLITPDQFHGVDIDKKKYLSVNDRFHLLRILNEDDPIIEHIFVLEPEIKIFEKYQTLDDLLNYVETISDKLKLRIIEGVVCKSIPQNEDEFVHSFKVINNKYLLKYEN